jgi:hypothetical protein
MLKPAQLYTDELKQKFWETAYDLKYQYLHLGWFEEYTVSQDTWGKHELVSIDSNDNLIGFISYTWDQRTNNVSGLLIINFSNNKIIFGKDILKAIKNIFIIYKANKINFNVAIGNPIEKTYDKIIQKYGGYIVGIRKKDIKILDGTVADIKIYEIFREDFLIHNKKICQLI